ncbi:MAG TPA: hypothetical protein VLG50_03900 [Candidatus Saccharimonadales bacterium]|nr:hypothetical protein [Candidatus Saccharimonadales bacterium]
MVSQSNYSMVWDNRYFPWFDQLYTGSDSRHSNLDVQGFFIHGGDAFRHQNRALEEEQIVSYPELWGELQLAQVGKSLTAVGLQNPIPADWLWLSDFDVRMPASLEGQGIALAGYGALTNHIGIGGSVFIMNLNSLVSLVPAQETFTKLHLNDPGNQALFTQTIQKFLQELKINSTTCNEVGVGDVVVYLNIYDVHEYRYKFRKIDWGVYLGLIIPSGTRANIHNLASVPFGGPYGSSWGWFIAPRAEFELREDLKFGIQGRLTQRMDTCFTGRIPIGKEQPLFAPVVGKINVDIEPTLSLSTYLAFEDLRAGFGIQAKYTLSFHDHDIFSTHIKDSTLRPKFNDMNFFSGWTQEYGTIRLFYDVGHDKTWDWRPIVYFTWDIPMNHLGGRGFAKTNRVSIGCNFNF